MLKISQNNDNRGRHLEFYFHTGIGNWFQCFPVYPGLNLSSGSGSGSEFRLFHTPVLHTAARLICCAPRFSHITPLMYELHWLPLKQRIHFKILLFAFKAIHGIAPTYIQNLVSLKSQGTYNLRSSGWILLASSTFRTKITLGDRSFQVAAPKLWYALSRELRDIPSLHTFTYLFKFAYG